MAEFTVKIDGVPIPVRGVANMREAQAAVQEAIQADSLFIPTQRRKFEETGGSAVNKFLIGAGKTFTDIGQGVEGALGDADRALAKEFNIPIEDFTFRSSEQIQAQEGDAQEFFDRIDNQGLGMEDVGQAAPFVIAGGKSTLAGAGKSIKLLTNLGKSFGLVGKKLFKFIRNTKETDLKKMPVSAAVEGMKTPQGGNLARTISQIDDPKVAGDFVSRMLKQGI